MKNRTESELDNFVNDLQNQIFDEARTAYGEIGFNRWRNPLYMGAMRDADGHGCITGSCGDTMEIFLKFENNKVEKASFQTNGCGSSTICGSFAAEMAIGKTPDELLEITGEKILQTLSVFPKEDEHCAFLAAETLQEALNDFMKKLAKSKKIQTAAA
jgi:nitrogen fixation protein NifU and related proteins